jgi:ABC-type nickel/cobalt efflux system permease component RcnA
MNNALLEKLVWVFVYGGILIMFVGLFIKRADTALGWLSISSGALLVAVGVLMIWIRSRRKN